ncbi:hypothetical protein CPB85DRAFT_1561878 [Mucidula mucida]|nr:hypothetical protein CPB85DRAFT_1561878 [Mucidula mucida]
MVGDEYVEDNIDEETLKTKKLVGPVTIWIGVFPDKEANVDYVKVHINLLDSIKCKIASHAFDIQRSKELIASYEEREKGTDLADVERAQSARIRTQDSVDEAEKLIAALVKLLGHVRRDWKKLYNHALGHILRSPAMRLGGNKIDLGTRLQSWEFKTKTFATKDTDDKYPECGLLPLVGTLTDDMMGTPDKLDADGEPCLLVVKRGAATDTTIGRANGVFSIVRDYCHDMSIHQTSMEWAVINYGYGTDAFSKPGDSGAIIADIHGRIGGMLTGGSGSGHKEVSDITYATPFWWLLANGFPDAHPDVLADMDLDNVDW